MKHLTKALRPGTYVVSMCSSAIGIRKFDAGCIAMVIDRGKIRYDNTTYLASERNIKEGTIKWFETLEEAQAFSKSLFPPSIPKTKTFDDFGIDPEMEYECDIINSWQTHGKNRWDDPKDGWEKSTGHAYGNRKLSKIQLKDGVYALYVKGSSNTWIRAEGFIQYYRSELLKMAIKIYPIGTNYCSAFDGTADGECMVTPCWYSDDAIIGGNRYIWYKGNWGKILDVPTEKNEEPVDKGWFDKELPVEEEFKIGDIVTITSWHFGKIPLPQKGIIKEIGKSDQLTPYQIELSKSSETKGETFSAGSRWWFKPGEFVKGFTENTIVEHSNVVEQEEAIPELTHNIKPNSINNNLKSTTAVVGTIKQKSKTIKF